MRHKIDPDAPIIVLSITLQGEDAEKKIDMALDTGATYTMIPWEIAEILGYNPGASKERIPLITASGVERAPLITLKSISVLGKGADNVQVVVHNLPEKSYVDGLLGLSFLKRFKLSLDFRAGILELE
ncbi:retroviral-like aspartic protease family protein [Dehalococcoidia bacterium]|nr:retroviral-like aspartic protease family protein [Dehalococcoidia bacterium]